jgi:carbonic anhydrase
VRRIRQHPLVSSKIPIYGYLYDVHSGKLIEINEAIEVGRPR